MQATQLACPHCGSTLNFGTEIAAGTTVECLICMRTFAAAPMPATPAAPPVAVAAPSAEPTPSAVATKPSPKPPPINKPVKPSEATPSAPRIRRPTQAAGGGRVLLVAVACGLFLALGAGGAVVIWKIATASSDPVTDETPLVQTPDPEPQKDAIFAKNTPVSNPAKKTDDPFEEIERKLPGAKLKRKTPASGGNTEIDWTPPINFKEQRPVYAGLSQKKIDDAIAKGVAWLKLTQTATGTWSDAHSVGHAALGGLTLLECNVPANDAKVQRAAHHVRMNLQNLDFTYEVSLAILFLDRLGEPRDRPLIQGLALKLLAGQNDCGGWAYNCLNLNPQEMYQLYVFLHSNRQPTLLNPLPTGSERNLNVSTSIPRNAPKSKDPFQQFGFLMNSGNEEAGPDKQAPAVKKKNTAPLRPEWLQVNLQGIPVVKNQGKGKGKQRIANGGGDNSNTQFALLALWAARRHDIPSEQAIMAAYQRFVVSQTRDGGWGYSGLQDQNATDAMTCVGLLGLAMGHGTAPDIIQFDPKNPKDAVIRPALEDPRIKAGLKRLASHIGEPMLQGDPNSLAMQSLYWMWSIERVAMLYDLKTINGKEWYPWGAQILVHRQEPDGQWAHSNYPGAVPPVNTCFALLFLKRSNLVQDLTNNLRLYTAIRDPESDRPR